MICEVRSEFGLHLRTASRLAQVANGFESTIVIECREQAANARNVMELILLGVVPGTILRITVDGSDALAAIAAIKSTLEENSNGE
jgi:phosphotransferase system HPr (HPr) family protein